MFGVYVYAVAHHEASFGLEGTSAVPTPRLRARQAILSGTADRRCWLSARALVFENSGRAPQQEPLAIRDTRRVFNGERRSRASKVLTGAFVP
jgi:hypothetical protein